MRGHPDAIQTATGRDWLSVVSLVTIVIAFGVVAGPLGVLAGIATALVGYQLGTPYALAAGHVALVVSLPDGIDPLSFGIVEGAFVAVLLVSVFRTTSPKRVVLVAITSTLALAGLAWLVVDSQSVTTAAAVVLGVLAVAMYGLHRLELVRLGLVPDGDESDPARQTGLDRTGEPTVESTTDPTPEMTTDTQSDT